MPTHCTFQLTPTSTPTAHTYQCSVCGFTLGPYTHPKLKIKRNCPGKPTTPVIGPTVTQKLTHYALALKRWANANYPVRDDAVVKEIFDKHCSKCHLYDKGVCKHEDCGCAVGPPDQQSILYSFADLIGVRAPAEAMSNKLKMATERCPIGKWSESATYTEGQHDLVIFLLVGNPLWDLTGHLANIGVKAKTINAVNNKLEEVERAIEYYQPRLIINRSFCIGSDVVELMLVKHPHIKWLTINHSSQAHLITQNHWIESQNKFIELTTKYPNCYYGTPDERNPIGETFNHERILWIPNMVTVPTRDTIPTLTEFKSKVPVVSLVSRRDVVKNIPTQILAAAQVNKTVPLKLLLLTKGGDDLVTLAKSLGLECEYVPWLKQSEYLDLIGKRVDVCLQATFTDTFNYTAMDHLGYGIPVVGSPAVRYLPQEWQAQPDDVNSIAKILSEHCSDQYFWRAHTAREIAKRVASTHTSEFKLVINQLLT